MHPRRPHGHLAPPILTTMWPISPAPPRPIHGLPLSTRPPPTPVPQNTPSSDLYGLPAPSLNSASVATWTSLPTNTGVPSPLDSASPRPKLPSQSGRLRAVETAPVSASITPGEPTPTPRSADVSSSAAAAASRTASIICSATSSGPPSVGVGRRAEARTLFWELTITASILVPPRSIPPRAALLLEGMLGSSQRRRRSGISGPGLAVVRLLGRGLVDPHPQRRQLQPR